jgi:hypothetical protein
VPWSRYRRSKRQVRLLVWLVRTVALLAIVVIGLFQFAGGGSGLLAIVPMTTLRAVLDIDQEQGGRFDFSVAMGPRRPAAPAGSVAEAVLEPRRSNEDVASSQLLVPAPADASAKAHPTSFPASHKGPAAKSLLKEDKEKTLACATSLLGGEATQRDDKMLRVSLPSTEGGQVDGYGMNEFSFPQAIAGDQRPSYTLPILEWIQSQGAISGYRKVASAAPLAGAQLPNLLSPANSDGASEYIMSVAHGAVDFLTVGAGDFTSELNSWYHTLNAGFRTQIFGERSCVRDGAAVDRPGDDEIATIPARRRLLSADNLFVSDAVTRIFDFEVEGRKPSPAVGRELRLAKPGLVSVTAVLVADLNRASQEQSKVGWNTERARIGNTQTVNIEVVVNGRVVASKPVVANGREQTVAFKIPVSQSSWVALRLMGAAHTNPVFVLVDNMPVRASRASVEWSIRSLQEIFQANNARWKTSDYLEARAAYEYSYAVYQKILAETTAP